MHKSNQIINIHQKLLCINEQIPINVGFTYSDTLFDNTIKHLLDNTINFIEHDNDMVSCQSIMINNPVQFSIQEINTNINKVLFFHDETILHMKKEDKYLFHEKTLKYKKYSFYKNISLLFPDVEYINYGFQINSNNNRDKDVLLIGANNENMESVIFDQIKSRFPNSKIMSLKEIHNTNIDIKSIIEQYKICICMNSKYNRLLAASCGCFVISFEEDQEIPYYSQLNNLEAIMDNIALKIIDYENIKHLHSIISEKICSKYNCEIFESKIKNIIKENLL